MKSNNNSVNINSLVNYHEDVITAKFFSEQRLLRILEDMSPFLPGYCRSIISSTIKVHNNLITEWESLCNNIFEEVRRKGGEEEGGGCELTN